MRSLLAPFAWIIVVVALIALAVTLSGYVWWLAGLADPSIAPCTGPGCL